MLTGKLGRRSVGLNNIIKLLSANEENEGNRLETLRIKVMKSWIAVRAWKTEYFVMKSLFSPGSTMIVTISVAFMVAKVTYRSSLLHHNNGGANLIFCFEYIFILVGWILILWRWFKVAFYCGNSVNKVEFFFAVCFSLSSAFIVGHVLCPTLVVRLVYSLKNRDFTLTDFLIFISCLAPILLLFVLILAASLLCLFCFICWCLSDLVFSSQFVQHLFKFENEGVSRNNEYSKYQSVLHGMGLNEDNIHIFWKVNKESFSRIKGSTNEVSRIVPKKRSGLLSIMGSASVAENHCFRLHDRKNQSWMGAVSIIFSAIAGAEIGVDMTEVFAAYKEVRDVLKFVDYPDNVVVDTLNIFGNLNLDGVMDSFFCELNMYAAEKGLSGAVQINQERVNELVRELNSLGSEMFNSPLITIDERCYDNVEAFSEKLRMMVGHVIVSCMLEAPDLLVKYSRLWAENFDEGRIERATELAQKVSGLLENLVKDGDIHSEETGQVASQSQTRTSEADIGPGP